MARIVLLITFMAWTATVWAAEPEGPVLSLEEAIALARDYNPTLKNAKIELSERLRRKTFSTTAQFG